MFGRARWLKIITIGAMCVEIGEMYQRRSLMPFSSIRRKNAEALPGVYVDYVIFYLYVLPDPPPFIQHIPNKKLVAIAPYLSTASTTLAVQIFATTLIAYKAW